MAAPCTLCCVFNNNTILDLSDPCVCNAPIGATLVTTTGDIYIRTTISLVCDETDWTLIAAASGGLYFTIEDSFATSGTINNGDALIFVGQNGATATITAPDTVVIDGHMYYSNVAPSSAPADTSSVNMHLNCALGQIYVWCPSSLSWQGPIGGSGSFTLSDGTNTQAIAPGNTLLVSSPDSSVTVLVSATDNLRLSVDPNNLPVDDVGAYFVATNVETVLQEIGANMHPRAHLTNLAAAFSWNDSTQAGNIPQVPTLVDNGNNTWTYTPGNGGSVVTIDPAHTTVTFDTTSITFTYPSGATVVVNICDMVAACLPTNLLASFTTNQGIEPITSSTDVTLYFVDTSHATCVPNNWEWFYSLDPSPGAGYTWVSFSTSQNPTFTFTLGGYYHLRLVISCPGGATDEYIVDDFVHILAASLDASFTYAVDSIFGIDACADIPVAV